MRPTLYVLLGVLLVANVGFAGDIVTDGKFKSTQASGAPLEVASDDMVLNLNADMVDGVEGTDIYTKAEVDAAVAAAGAADSRRWFYVTPGVVDNGANALTACDAGFHMASKGARHQGIDVTASPVLNRPDDDRIPPVDLRSDDLAPYPSHRRPANQHSRTWHLVAR